MIENLINYFHELYQQFMIFSQQNQFLAGGVAIWALTVASVLLRNIPARIWGFIKRHSITTVTMNNTDWDKRLMMHNFLNWFQENGYAKHSRTFSLNPLDQMDGDGIPIVSAGYGYHFFFYKKRFMWMNIHKLDSSGGNIQKEEISISLIGRSYKPFLTLAKEFTPPISESRSIYEFNLSDREWIPTKDVIPKKIESVAMNPKVKEFVTGTVKNFLDSKEWYYNRGLPYKMTSILHGIPGTGKTSLIRVISSHYSKNICILNISKMSDDIFLSAINSVPKDSVLCIEDFDSSGAFKDRTEVKKDGDDVMYLTLSGVLNALDGVSGLDDTIIFLTTNHLDHIDKAVYRKGRVDHVIEVEALDPEVVEEHSKRLYPDYEFPDDLFHKPLVGCHLHSAMVYAMDEPELYVEYLRDVWDNDKHLQST